MSDYAGRRESYGRAGLRRADLHADPFEQFRAWQAEWDATGAYDGTAVALATADAAGRPSVRFVLLKGLDHGFVFFSNDGSRKAAELAANAQAALCFGWLALERQVRVVGPVDQVDPAEAAAYFATRPRGSQIANWASEQSRPIGGRDELDARVARLEERFGAGEVPVSPHFRGWRVVPDEIEFWQGRPNRLHDRFVYLRTDDGWAVTRLQP